MDLALDCRGGDFGPGHLPFSGGVAEQPAALMQAIAIVHGALATIRERTKGKGG